MNAYHFIDNVKVQRFCLTLLGEATLWFQSLEPLENTTWPQLQNIFRQRYSKLGNTHEQLFHAWKSFNFDENTETIDSYVMQIRQVATPLGMESHKYWKYSRTHFQQNCRLAAKDSYEKRPFKPQIYKSRGQSRSYNERGYQNRGGRLDSRSRGQYGNNRPRQNYRDNNFQRNTRVYGRQNNREEYRDNRCNE